MKHKQEHLITNETLYRLIEEVVRVTREAPAAVENKAIVDGCYAELMKQQ